MAVPFFGAKTLAGPPRYHVSLSAFLRRLSSSSNLGASTLTPIRTRCLQQGVVTLVSKNQISPDSLPSYIRELAPEPTRGKKKGKSITDYHRRASTEFQTLSPYLQYLRTNKPPPRKQAKSLQYHPSRTRHLYNLAAALTPEQSSLINLELVELLELLEYHKPRSSSSLSHTQSTCLPTALHNCLLAPAHHPAVRSLLYQSRASSLTTTTHSPHRIRSIFNTRYISFAIWTLSNRLSSATSQGSCKQHTSRSIQSHAYTYKSTLTDTKRIASRKQPPSWPPIASCAVMSYEVRRAEVHIPKRPDRLPISSGKRLNNNQSTRLLRPYPNSHRFYLA